LKGPEPQTYETLYGPVTVSRNIFQSEDGSIYCPLESQAGIVGNVTPHLARMIKNKAKYMPVDIIADDIFYTFGAKLNPEIIHRVLKDQLAPGTQKTSKELYQEAQES
jgi:hypothetical protein